MSKCWYFTFGYDDKNRDRIAKVNVTDFSDARRKMFELYSDKWCWQYEDFKGEKLIKQYGYEVIEVE